MSCTDRVMYAFDASNNKMLSLLTDMLPSALPDPLLAPGAPVSLREGSAI